MQRRYSDARAGTEGEDPSATYGSAGKLLTLNGRGQNPSGGLNGMTESFTYNNMMQLTGITGYAACQYGYANCPGPANINMQYAYDQFDAHGNPLHHK